jgi:hypothetical protein
MDELLLKKYDLVGATAVKRVSLFSSSKYNDVPALSQMTLCEIVAMFALEGLSRREGDVLAPILKTVIVDDLRGEVYLAMT